MEQRDHDMLVIRTAERADIETLAAFNVAMALESEQLQLDEPTVLRGVRRAFDTPELATYFVAEADSRVIGQLMITPELTDWRDGLIWWIQSVYVHPKHRGRGVFKHIYQHVEQIARADPEICALRLYVHDHNPAAMDVYRRLGMQDAGYRVFERVTR